MLLAANSPWLDWGLLVVVLVCTAVVVSRTLSRIGGQGGQTHEEIERAESSAERRVGALEVQIHDFAREVEARLEKRAVELDALVAAADREIVRLTDLLKSSAPAKDSKVPEITRHAAAIGSSTELSGAQEQMIVQLRGAGFNVSEIAHMVGRPPEDVDSILKAA
jgi:hypothetical protein